MAKRIALQIIRYWVPFVCYAAVIVFLSTRPGSDLPKITIPDKVLHAVEYAVFGFLFFRVLWRQTDWQTRDIAMIMLVGLLLFATLDEWVQSFVANRDSSFYDWLADLGGGMAGAWTYKGLAERYLQREKIT